MQGNGDTPTSGDGSGLGSGSDPTVRGDWRLGLRLHAPDLDAAGLAALPEVGAIRFDSRAVHPGDLFVCIAGERHDGHQFAAAAVEAGATVLVIEHGRTVAVDPAGVSVVAVADPRAAMSAIAAAHEGYPAEQLTVIGVTGTDGKSTTAFLILDALEGCGLRAGVLSTVESRIAGRVIANPTRLTTQEAPGIQAQLRAMVDAGCTHAVIEATSHGLNLHRLDDCAFDVAVFTNLTPDHLDFHGSIESYRAAKGRLFTMLDAPTTKARPRVAVLNADDPQHGWFAQQSAARVMRYGLAEAGDDGTAAPAVPAPAPPDAVARQVVLGPSGSRFRLRLEASGADIPVEVPLPGRFNVANATAALAAAVACGLDPRAAAAGIAASAGVPGRMERIALPAGAGPDGTGPDSTALPFEVIVDYAHTPEAMAQVLATLRPLVSGRLIVVFGAAGERSRDRRTGLGRVVADLADLAIVTEEDPRSEPPGQIIEQIMAAMIAAGVDWGRAAQAIENRMQAIEAAITMAGAGDLVLIAGKGHESTIERADGSHPWDDRAAARAALRHRVEAAG